MSWGTYESLGDGCSITLVRDGDNPKRPSGNIIGIYWTPMSGGYSWYAENGDCGDCDTEAEARQEILSLWPGAF